MGSGEAVSSLRGAGPGADKAKGGGNLKEAALEHEKAAQGKQPASAEKPKKPAPALPKPDEPKPDATPANGGAPGTGLVCELIDGMCDADVEAKLNATFGLVFGTPDTE